ncbi:MAG: hypothetical protein JWN93_2073 [Hyphomicrobiales bacterium]|nr:hypothetical protein [Hyphomicrobiales bacterium]
MRYGGSPLGEIVPNRIDSLKFVSISLIASPWMTTTKLGPEQSMSDWYAWAKALHVIAIISWMAGLLYLPRLFVYHVPAVKLETQNETFKTMERKLYGYIMTPAMVVAWGTGLLMASAAQLFVETWFLMKLVLVGAMTGSHLFLGHVTSLFQKGENAFSSRFFRLFNEVPTLLMIGIVCLVIVKPF